jgi:hypothetical protein
MLIFVIVINTLIAGDAETAVPHLEHIGSHAMEAHAAYNCILLESRCFRNMWTAANKLFARDK